MSSYKDIKGLIDALPQTHPKLCKALANLSLLVFYLSWLFMAYFWVFTKIDAIKTVDSFSRLAYGVGFTFIFLVSLLQIFTVFEVERHLPHIANLFLKRLIGLTVILGIVRNFDDLSLIMLNKDSFIEVPLIGIFTLLCFILFKDGGSHSASELGELPYARAKEVTQPPTTTKNEDRS